MFYTDDPIRDHYDHEARLEQKLARLPRCSECGEPIQEEVCYEFNDELICEDCVMRYHRKYVDDYIS